MIEDYTKTSSAARGSRRIGSLSVIDSVNRSNVDIMVSASYSTPTLSYSSTPPSASQDIFQAPHEIEPHYEQPQYHSFMFGPPYSSHSQPHIQRVEYEVCSSSEDDDFNTLSY
jgi:hypothetical protein